MNRFVADTWREEFKPFASEFQRMERTLIANNHYAKAKYEDLKPKIEGMKKGGATFFKIAPAAIQTPTNLKRKLLA